MQDFKMPFSEKTASIGVNFDVPNKKETIIIGSPKDVKRYYTTGILSKNADLRTRRLGTLVDEINELAQAADGDKIEQVIAASNGLCDILNSGQGNKAASGFTETLYNLYDTSANANMLFNLYACTASAKTVNSGKGQNINSGKYRKHYGGNQKYRNNFCGKNFAPSVF